MTVTARGIDVSTWQHPGQAPIDWEEVAASGVTFALVKATQGVAYINPWFDRDYEDAFAAGLLVGAYHFYEAGADAVAQAKLFTDVLIGKRLGMHAWLDFEAAPVTNWTAAGWVNAFLEAARDARPGCGLYCDESWWAELQSANVVPPVLWLAAPDATEPPVGATVWQRGAGTVPGVPAEVDLDELCGTRGINLPTAPARRPTAVTTVPVRLPEEPTEDEDGQDSDAGSARAGQSLPEP